MAKLLMNLRGVPEDEANEVRELLREHAVDFYETPPNRWGLSMGAIWLREEADYERVRRLLDTYQRQRAERARTEFAEQQRTGTQETFISMFLRDPVRNVLYVCLVVVILYFSIKPFMTLM